MNFIKETDPYLRELDAWKKGHGWSNRESLKRLAEIWDEFKNIPERKKEIFGSIRSVIPNTDLSCGNCVHDLLTFVWNWRAKLEHEVTVYFQGVPQAVVETKGDVTFDTVVPPSQNVVDMNKGISEVILDGLKNMKMHELRAIAKKKGVVYSNKTTSAELIKLINDKDNG